MERNLLRNSCVSRNLHDSLVESGLDKTFSPKGSLVFNTIKDYYDADPNATRVDVEVLKHDLLKNKKHGEMLVEVVAGVDEDDTLSPANWRRVLVEGRVEDINERIATQLLDPTANQGGIDTLIQQRQEILHSGDEPEKKELYNGIGAEVLLGRIDGTLKVPLAPNALNNHLGGGVHRPSHIVVFARPDVGKTTFVLNQIVAFTQQGLRCLYYGNEDAPQVVLFRTLQAYTGASEKQIRGNPTRANEMAKEKGYDLSTFYFSEAGSLGEAESIATDVRADVIILDQLRNLSSSVRDNRVLELEGLARGAREMAKRRNAVVMSVTQAGDSAENKLLLSMGDIDWSNTGIQGTADLILGIGANEDYRKQGVRMVVPCKNKINGIKDGLMIRINEAKCLLKD